MSRWQNYKGLMPKKPVGLLHVPNFLHAEPPKLVPNGHSQTSVIFYPDNLAAYPLALDEKRMRLLIAVKRLQISPAQLAHLPGP